MRHHLGRFGGCFSSVCGVGTGGSKGPRVGPDCAVEDAIAYDVNGGVAESGTDGDGTGRTWPDAGDANVGGAGAGEISGKKSCA